MAKGLLVQGFRALGVRGLGSGLTVGVLGFGGLGFRFSVYEFRESIG